MMGTWTSILNNRAGGIGFESRQSSACHVCTRPQHERLFLQKEVRRRYVMKTAVSELVPMTLVYGKCAPNY
jgi:hypothetical protein